MAEEKLSKKTIQDIEEARKRIKAGEFITQEEVEIKIELNNKR